MERVRNLLLLIAVTFGLFGADVFGGIGVPVTVDLEGDLRSIAYDSGRKQVYVTNRTLNQVEVISLQTRSVSLPFLVGSLPQGLDLSHDGRYLWVANTGAPNLSKVDLDTGNEILPRTNTPNFPQNVTIASDGYGLVQTVGDTYEFDNGGTVGSDVGHGRNMHTSPDHTKLLHPTYSTVRMYDSGTGSWGPNVSIPGFGANWWDWVNETAVSNDGRWVLASNEGGTRILDENLAVYGTITKKYYGMAIDPWNRQAYGIFGTGLDVIDLARALVTESVTLPRSLVERGPSSIRLLISEDGSELYELNNNGVTIIPTGIPEPTTVALLAMGALAMIRRRSV